MTTSRDDSEILIDSDEESVINDMLTGEFSSDDIDSSDFSADEDEPSTSTGRTSCKRRRVESAGGSAGKSSCSKQ